MGELESTIVLEKTPHLICKKSVLEPTQTLEYLGVLINSQTITFSLPPAKMENLKTLYKETLQKERISVRNLASMIGKLMATAPAFTAAPLQVRFLQNSINQQLLESNQNYELTITLKTLAKEELRWWLENMNLRNGNPIKIQPPDLIIYSDAAKGQQQGG